MSVVIQKITKSDQKVALLSAKVLADSEDQATKNKDEVIKLKIQGSDEVVTIPLKALQLLNSIISNMAQGKSVVLMPTDAEVSTQQAAEILNVSRPHVIKLLEKGAIPHRKVGSHRRILLQDILQYESILKSERRKKLDYLAKEAQVLNLGYEWFTLGSEQAPRHFDDWQRMKKSYYKPAFSQGARIFTASYFTALGSVGKRAITPVGRCVSIRLQMSV